jgi:transporter family-2 protein
MTTRPLPSGAALVAAVLSGAMVGVQGRINGELATRMGSSLEAAAASFLVGLVLIATVMPWRRAAWQRLRRGRVRSWWWLGGVGGALLVSTSAHAVPEIGVALVSVCLVAGTTAGALLTDQFGLGPSGRHPASRWRYAGVAVVIIAVAIGAVGRTGGSVKPLLFAGLFAAGAVSAVQQAANGQLRAVADDAAAASFVSFLVGSIALVVVGFAAGAFSGSSFPSAAWLYLGGPLGLVYIIIGAMTVRALGVLRFILGVVSGQLLAAVVIDAAWPAPGTSLRTATVVGALITLVGVWLSGRDEKQSPAPQVAG